MHITITKKYLVFPVNTNFTSKKLTIKSLNTKNKDNPNKNSTDYTIYIKLDSYTPDFYSYIDVSRFMGQVVDINISPDMKLTYQEADEILPENLYRESLRPQIHFTAKNGWINDPNGLIYLNGVYHMFYQFNPAEPVWGNMHWGHAESTDLIHWTEKTTALFPDERGVMFSGCGFYDDKNVVGLNKDSYKTPLLFYTTTEPFCQYMSYSNDNFKTIKTYGDKPVVPFIVHGARDPKVVFCDDLDCYIMALYLEDDVYTLLKSYNLTDWQELQRISLPGDNECPDIFKLPVTKDNTNTEYKWVIIGAHDKYLVGDFKTGKFKSDQQVLSFHYGLSAYAGQSFSNLPDNRVVRMVWDRQDIHPQNFNGQMGIPMEMSLEYYNGTYYLQGTPVKELSTLYQNTDIYTDVSIKPENEFNVPLKDTPQLIKIKSDFIKSGNINFSVFGREIKFNFAKNEFKVGESPSPISITEDNIDLTIITDRCSMEIFSDKGKIFASYFNQNTVMDRNLPYFKITTAQNITLNNISITSLASIWEEDI